MANARAAGEEGEARARPKHHQPVPSQYRKWWVMGQWAWSGSGQREKTYSRVLAQVLLGKMSYWDNMPPKRSKDKLEPPGACHEG